MDFHCTNNKTEWTAEKWVDKPVQSKQTTKHQPSSRTNRWSKVQEDPRCMIPKAVWAATSNNADRQHRLKNDLIFNLRISKEFRFISSVCLYYKKYPTGRFTGYDLTLATGLRQANDKTSDNLHAHDIFTHRIRYPKICPVSYGAKALTNGKRIF